MSSDILLDMKVSQKSLTLSVVIPCYNEADTIAACLDGLVHQKTDVAEIIIVDNNSSDNTVKIIKKYQAKHNYIRLLREKKQGVQFARNTGLNAAKSDIIARIDADTIVEKDWSSQLLDFYADGAHKTVGAASGYSWYYDLPFKRVAHFFTNLFTHFANQKLADSHTIYGANMSLRKPVWQKIKNDVCMRQGIMEDQDLGYHVIDKGFTTGYIPKATARVSGRRMRMSPLRYWRYNRQWWMTYYNHRLYDVARRVRVMAWVGNGMHAAAWVGLLFHNPNTGHFSVRYFLSKKVERTIP